MPVAVQFVADRPQHEVSSLLRSRLASCTSLHIVSGFLTPDGADALNLKDHASAVKVSRFVVGAGTFKAFEAVEQMIAAGANASGVRIHLGHSRASSGKKNPFVRYHPMLHSKVYYFESVAGTASAFVGSHNVTGFALRGLNGEAGVLLDGPASDPVFADIRRHIGEAFKQAVPYDPSLKEAYAWWTREYFDGLSAEANDAPRDYESKSTTVVLAAGQAPPSGEVLYFELPAALSKLRAIESEVHLYVFDALPSSPAAALSLLGTARTVRLCRTEGIELESGGVELDAQWAINDSRAPTIAATVRPFRPRTAAGMQQVRVRVADQLGDAFEYLFDQGRSLWQPEFGADEGSVRDPAVDMIWSRVTGLYETDRGGSRDVAQALLEASPESGSFILFSRRRRRKKPG